jgi:hypothetical protein
MTHASPRLRPVLSVDKVITDAAASEPLSSSKHAFSIEQDAAHVTSTILRLFSQRDQTFLIRYYGCAEDPSIVAEELQFSEQETRDLRRRAKALFTTMMDRRVKCCH